MGNNNNNLLQMMKTILVSSNIPIWACILCIWALFCVSGHVPSEFKEANDTSGHVERQESDDDD